MASQYPQIETLNTDAETFKQQYKDLLQKYLRDTSFEVLPSTYDLFTESAVVEYLRAQDFSPDYVQRYKPIIQAGAWIATSTYPFTPARVREAIAIYSTLAIMIEDTSKENLTDLKSFHDRLLHRQPQANKLLETTIHFIQGLRGIYGPFISEMITKATMEFISVCIFEQEYEGIFAAASSTPEFPWYLRLKTGIGEAYAFFAFPEALYPEDTFLPTILPTIPYLLRFFDLGNDFFSFYKESVVSNDRLNYIHNCSRANSITPTRALEDASSSLSDCVRIVREALSVNPQLRDNIEQLFHGYAMYHFGTERYRLSELSIPEIDDVREKIHFP
ncbi:putative trichodiene synthase [Jackrogersella minutella]|nr:putative trichodiene synthase [Jackrogersella minutella]